MKVSGGLRDLFGKAAFERSNLTLRQFRYFSYERSNPGVPIERFHRLLSISPHLAVHLEVVWDWASQAADATRARLVVDEGVPFLRFEDAAAPFQRVELSDHSAPSVAVQRWAREQRWTEFGDGDLLHRQALVTLPDGELVWMLTANHLVSDGRSVNILMETMVRGMTALSRGDALPELSLPSFEANMASDRQADLEKFSSASRLGSAGREGQELSEGKAFSLFGVQTVTASLDRPIGHFSLSQAEVSNLFELLNAPEYFYRSENVSLANFFVALTAVWVWRHGGPLDQVVGVPFHGRKPGEENLIGFKSEVLAVHVCIDPSESFASLVRKVHVAVAESRRERGQSVANPLHAPVFNTFVSNTWQSNERFDPDSGVTRLEIEKSSGSAEFLNFQIGNAYRAEGGMRAIFRFRPEISEKTKPEWLADGFRSEVLSLIDHADKRVRDVRFHEPESSALLEALESVVQPEVPVSWVSAWSSKLDLIGDQVALRHGNAELSHRQLFEAAGRWQALMRGLGLQPGDRALVCAPNSNALAALWLGLMSAGGVFVPVHHTTPADRIRGYAENLNARFLFAGPRCELGELSKLLTCISIEEKTVEGLSATLLNDPPATAPAHIFQTSGSTGSAKPILVSHQALASSIRGWIDALGLKEGERIFHFYSVTFDPWLTGILPALWLGGTSTTHSGERPPTSTELIRSLEQHAISTLYTPTAFFHALCDLKTPSTLRRWVVGGETLAPDKAARYLNAQGGVGASAQSASLVNAYGPTETTIWASVVEVTGEHGDTVPIGRPISTCGFRIADAKGDALPFGVPGELWITGPQVAQGYIGLPELSAQCFVIRDGKRWYRTGDVVRLRHDGQLDFLGRADRQVQVRGFRVEPGEIERVLRAQPELNDALVVPQAAASTTALCAYVVGAESAGPIDDNMLRIALLRELPEYKVPRWIVSVESFPYNANGKVNVDALPSPTEKRAPQEPDRLPSLTLWDLRFAFEEVLDLPRVGVSDDFFSLGGDSLLLVELIANIERRFGKTLEPAEVILNPTIGGLAPLLETDRRQKASLIVPLRQGAGAPLFCIPGAGGIGVEFYPLARQMPESQPVIVLRSSGTDGHSKPPDTLDALLDEHEAHILAWREAHGDASPLLLMGYSFGGIIAYELAQRFASRGVAVAHVVLVDSHLAGKQGLRDRAKKLLSPVARLKSALGYTPENRERILLLAELDEAIAQGRIMDAAKLGRLNFLSQARLANEIVSTTSEMPATYFLASDGARHTHALLWKALLPNLTVEIIDGHHDGEASILREPNVKRLAQELLKVLEESTPSS